jgi:phospholipid-binding lipoprotein MlaA
LAYKTKRSSLVCAPVRRRVQGEIPLFPFLRLSHLRLWLLCHLILAVLAAPALGGLASDDDALLAEYEEELQVTVPPDPMEGLNRRTFWLNRKVDDWLFDPVTRAYRFLCPPIVRDSLRRFVLNINSPPVLINDLLQRRWGDAGVTTGRFLLNTTFGIAGLVDPAAEWGLPGHHADFGQTMAMAGVSSGAYLIVPILGPTTLRDGTGDMIGLFFRPTTYFLGAGELLTYNVIQGGTAGLIARERNAEGLRRLEESSVDYYAAMRSAYAQSRHAQIWERQIP